MAPLKQQRLSIQTDPDPEEVVLLNQPEEIKKLLDAANMVDYAGHGFRWHLSAIVDALHVLSGCDKSTEYRRDRTCLDDTSCRQCGAKDGHVRTKLIDWGEHERETWDGMRWQRS